MSVRIAGIEPECAVAGVEADHGGDVRKDKFPQSGHQCRIVDHITKQQAAGRVKGDRSVETQHEIEREPILPPEHGISPGIVPPGYHAESTARIPESANRLPHLVRNAALTKRPVIIRGEQHPVHAFVHRKILLYLGNKKRKVGKNKQSPVPEYAQTIAPSPFYKCLWWLRNIF